MEPVPEGELPEHFDLFALGPLHLAAQEGRLGDLLRILGSGTGVDSQDEVGRCLENRVSLY